jgi:hypothetical protein
MLALEIPALYNDFVQIIADKAKKPKKKQRKIKKNV